MRDECLNVHQFTDRAHDRDVENDPVNFTDPSGLKAGAKCPFGMKLVVYPDGTSGCERGEGFPLPTIWKFGSYYWGRSHGERTIGAIDPIVDRSIARLRDPSDGVDVEAMKRVMACSGKILDAGLAVAQDGFFLFGAAPAAWAMKVRRGLNGGAKLDRVMDVWKASYVSAQLFPGRAGLAGARSLAGSFSLKAASSALQGALPEIRDLIFSTIPVANSFSAIYGAGKCILENGGM